MLTLILASVTLFSVGIQGYQVPQATVQALKPRGLRISIPDVPGTQLFAVNGNINKPIKKSEVGQLSKDTIHPKDGRWIVEIPQARIKVGDSINYWIYVQAEGKQFYAENLVAKVTELVDPKQPTSPTGPTNPPCQQTVTTVNSKSSCKGQLIFEEQFDSLSPSKWKHDILFAGAPGYEFVVYSDDARNSFVTDGKLRVRPTLLTEHGVDVTGGTLELSGCTEGQGIVCSRSAQGWDILNPIQSARLTTKQSFSFRYGRIDVRARVPSGDWIYPEILLQPKSNFYGQEGFESGLMQLALVRGNRNLMFEGKDIGSNHLETVCTIGTHNSVHSESISEDASDSWSSDFHTYGMTWTPDHITFKVDGKEIGKMVPPMGGFSTLPEFSQIQNRPWTRGTKIAPFDQEFYLSIGVGVGGILQFPDDSKSSNHPKPWKNLSTKAKLNFWQDKNSWYPTWNGNSTLYINYVKVWAL